MIIQCQCGKQLRVSEELIGRKVRCPQCREIIVVRKPRRSRPPRRKKKPKPARTRSAAASRDAYDDQDDDSLFPGTRKRQPRRRPKRKSQQSGGLVSWAIVAGGLVIGLVMYFVVIPQVSLKFKRSHAGVTAPPTAPDHHDAVGTWRVDLAATKARTSDPEFLTKLDQISRVTITLEIDVDGTCYTSLQYGLDTVMLAGRWGILDDGDLYMNYSHQDGQRLPLKKIDNAELESPDTLVVMTSEAVTGKPRYMVYRR